MSPSEIAAHRKRLGLQQVDVAAIVGVSRGAVSAWECGTRRPDTTHLGKLRRAFDLVTPEGLCPMRPTGCGCRCHGQRPREGMRVLETRRRTG